MKNLLFGFITTVLFVFCGNAQDVSKLSEDKSFQTYLRNEFDFNKKATNTTLINELILDGKIEESELSNFYLAFSTNESQYKQYLENQKMNSDKFTSLYKLDNLSQSELSSLLQVEISEVYNNYTEFSKLDTNCRGIQIAQYAL